jgi:hypothetical protein
MGECYGTMYYLEHNADRVKRTIAAMCIDSPAGLQTLAGTEYTWILNPQSASSYVDAFALRLAEEYYPSVGRPWSSSPHRSSTDNYLGDPSIGIPTVMPRGGYGVNAHHNSGDTPATVDPKSLRDLMVMNAAYTYFLASAGPVEFRWMAQLALSRGYSQVAAAAADLAGRAAVAKTAEALSMLQLEAQERLDFTAERQVQAVESARSNMSVADLLAFASQQKDRLAAAIRERAADLGLATPPPFIRPHLDTNVVVRRKRMGTITLDDLPRDQREGFPAASFWGVPVSALYWCDGKRPLSEVIRLTQLEMGSAATGNFDFVGYFTFLEKHGYVELVNARIK